MKDYIAFGKGMHKHGVETVKLIRSKAYDMFERRGRIGFFEQLAKVLFYVNSGKAEILYLSDNPLNPLWAVMLPRFHD